MKLKIPHISLISHITLIILTFLLFLHPFEGGGDFYHHVNTGKQILEQGTFPFTDIYTHTANGQPWIAHSWASGIILYLVFSWFGPTGISFLVSIIGTLTIVLLYYLLRSLRISKRVSLLCSLLAIGPVLTRFPNRPEIFTYPLVLLLLLVDQYRIKFPKLNFMFPVIILLWANFYGSSVIAGICLILLLAVKQLLTSRISHISHISLIYPISLLVSLLNPNTYKTVFYMFIYIPKVAEYEGEWAGIWTILNNTPEGYILLFQYLILVYFIYLGLFLLILLFGIKNILKQKFLLLLSPAVFIPIYAFRHLPLAAILSLPLMAYLLNRINSRILNFITLLCAGVMIAIMLWLRPVGINVDTGPSDRLVNFIKQNGITGKAFDHSTTGSFLSYSLYPEVQVFFDTRDDLFKDNPAFTDLYNAQMSSANILPLLDKYHIDLVVADFFSDGLNYRELFNSSSWVIVYFDDRYFVAIKRATAQAKNLQPIEAIDPFSTSGSKPGQEPQAENYYRGISQTPSNQLLLVQTLIAQSKNREAIDVLQKLNMPPDLTRVLLQKQQDYFLVKTYLEVKDCQNAQTYFDRLQKEVRGNFIFAPGKKLVLIDDDIKALYYLRCLNDRTQADFYMKQYLNRRDINTKEKIKFQERYNSNLNQKL